VAFVLPTIIGFPLGGGWHCRPLAAFSHCRGSAQFVVLQHCTFLPFNSALPTISAENAPIPSKCSARDSWLMAIVTFWGKGYPQLSSRISVRLPKRCEAVAVRSDQVDDLGRLLKLGAGQKASTRSGRKRLFFAELAEAKTSARENSHRWPVSTVTDLCNHRGCPGPFCRRSKKRWSRKKKLEQIEPASRKCFRQLRREIRAANAGSSSRRGTDRDSATDLKLRVDGVFRPGLSSVLWSVFKFGRTNQLPD